MTKETIRTWAAVVSASSPAGIVLGSWLALRKSKRTVPANDTGKLLYHTEIKGNIL